MFCKNCNGFVAYGMQNVANVATHRFTCAAKWCAADPTKQQLSVNVKFVNVLEASSECSMQRVVIVLIVVAQYSESKNYHILHYVPKTIVSFVITKSSKKVQCCSFCVGSVN